MAKNGELHPAHSRTPQQRKEREEEIQLRKMRRYPPSLNGINKNLP
ncbi:hypothetical protein [Cohnella boryungensis]|uniref:Uncharacterized protein n=1 Tax=Cohnella boryungensis TaxID=768479 RepID=A0ABV8SFZ2_9BACL